MENITNDILYTAIEARAKRRRLHVDLNRLTYANDSLYSLLSLPQSARILIVGIGHGHDALVALKNMPSITIVGVDPYHAADGNDDQDYRVLQGLIDKLRISSRLYLVQSTIEAYLASHPSPFDAIICPDVLHHIFVTRRQLKRSGSFVPATDLFKRLRDVSRTSAQLLISDTSRHGLRPWSHRAGLLKGNVDYATKQSWRQWATAATAAGWSMRALSNYVPYDLRRYRSFIDGSLGRYTVCDRYFVVFDNMDPSGPINKTDASLVDDIPPRT